VNYSVRLKRSAEKDLERIPDDTKRRVVEHITMLAREPRPRGCKKLKGQEDYRVRVGDYRIVYSIDDNIHTVEILAIPNRREVYRKR
jgi:mRNA interferase RelE/StbE